MISNFLIKICVTQHCTTLVHQEGPRRGQSPRSISFGYSLLWKVKTRVNQANWDTCFSRRMASPSWMGFALSLSPSWTTTSPSWMGFALSLGSSRRAIPLLLMTSNGLQNKVVNPQHKLTFHESMIFACSFSISCFSLNWFSGVNSPSPSRSLHLLQALAKNSLSSALALILWWKTSMW